jgi:hypothetical protein
MNYMKRLEENIPVSRVQEWTEKAVKVIQEAISNKIRNNPDMIQTIILPLSNGTCDIADWQRASWGWEVNDGMLMMFMTGKTFELSFWCNGDSVHVELDNRRTFHFNEVLQAELALYASVDKMNCQSTWDMPPRERVDKIKDALKTYFNE